MDNNQETKNIQDLAKIINIESDSLINHDLDSDLVLTIIETFDEQAELIVHLQNQLSKKDSGNGRKSQVLELLINHDSISILDIAKALSISTKNVSSQLTYLRSDGYKIFTDHRGRKVLNVETEVESNSLDD